MQTHLDALRRIAGALPELPGVYLWKDGNGRVLYVGKAVNLRSRVTSYFSSARRERRVRELITRARTIEHEVAASELEALFRESSLIKQVQPPYNRALRRPRQLFYLHMATDEDGHLEISRGRPDAGLTFGPFRTRAMAREVLQFVHDVLPLKKCRAVKPRCRPCIYFQMHRCAAPALDESHRLRHREAVQQLEYLLDGRTDLVMAWLVAKRERLSEAMLYERAAEMQARIAALEALIDRQLVLDAALHARCVLLHQEQRHDEHRLFVVAHGRVIAVRDAAGQSGASVAHWVALHAPVIESARAQELELDAATVLERWVSVNKRATRWSAIRDPGNEAAVKSAADYVLSGVSPTTALPAFRAPQAAGST